MIAAVPHEPQRSQYSWRGALVACCLNMAGMPMDLLFASRDIPNLPAWAPLMSSATGALLVIILLARRRNPTARLSAIVFLVNTGVLLVALWITSGAYAAAPGRWIPFQANKIGALAAAILAPDLATGIVSIGGFVGMVVLRYATLTAAQQERLPIAEPWVIFIYAVFALAMLWYRVHSVALAKRMLRIRTESIATQRLARTFLAMRDFTNTPLQTIELSAHILRARCPDMAPVLDRVDRSINRLYRLNRSLSVYESRIDWTEDDLTPDPTVLVVGH
jgi:hypothetical protein